MSNNRSATEAANSYVNDFAVGFAFVAATVARAVYARFSVGGVALAYVAAAICLRPAPLFLPCASRFLPAITKIETLISAGLYTAFDKKQQLPNEVLLEEIDGHSTT